jgi:hypothetical protein
MLKELLGEYEGGFEHEESIEYNYWNNLLFSHSSDIVAYPAFQD